jgi:type VI secretion system secreted protein VgrG
MFIPRIGQEVVIQFVEGDPDQPLAIGSVYNGDHQVPYPLPGEKTKATTKSNSSKGGGGFNEIRFEDLKGQEQVFIHAEKDQDNRVKNDSKEWIGKDRHLIIKKKQYELVEEDQHFHVKGDQKGKVEGTISVQAGKNMQEKVKSKYALDSGTEIHLKSGMNLVIESGTTLTLKVGSNFININSGGIFIKGTFVMLNSGGSAGSGAGSSPESPDDPKEAGTAQAGRVGSPPQQVASRCSAALAMSQAAQCGTPLVPT